MRGDINIQVIRLKAVSVHHSKDCGARNACRQKPQGPKDQTGIQSICEQEFLEE